MKKKKKGFSPEKKANLTIAAVKALAALIAALAILLGN